jgi:hypothetical protein
MVISTTVQSTGTAQERGLWVILKGVAAVVARYLEMALYQKAY